MTYYKKHLFFCTNQKDGARQCCENHSASEFWAYAKKRAKELGLNDVRINRSGCLGRCELGPVLVIYPEGTWYTYETKQDIDAILEQHLQQGTLLKPLLVDPEAS